MLVPGEVDPAAHKAHTLHFQTHALLQGGGSAKPDAVAGADHALPRQPLAIGAQDPDHLAVVERVPRGGRYLRVAGDFALRNGADGFADGGVAFGAGVLQAEADDFPGPDLLGLTEHFPIQ